LNASAKPFTHLSWQEYRAMIEDTWSPGSHAPFDPIAAQRAAELKTRVRYLNGQKQQNIT